VTVEQFRDFFAPLLAAGPVHAVIVGDVTLEQAVEAARRTIAALPARPELPVPDNAAGLEPPAPAVAPRRFTHRGDPNQAYAMIGWSTFGGNDRRLERRALALAANMFEARLFDRLREEEGATYSPDASHLTAEAFRRWGVFTAAAEVRPANAPTFFRIAREIVADLARNPATREEFARAQNPVISGIERLVATNAYWASVLDNWHRDPRDIENVRHYLADYRALTPEDVRRAVNAHVTDRGDWSMLVLPGRESAAREANGEQ
jgi:zinc protease